jgi:hypothetical protein
MCSNKLLKENRNLRLQNFGMLGDNRDCYFFLVAWLVEQALLAHLFYELTSCPHIAYYRSPPAEPMAVLLQ